MKDLETQDHVRPKLAITTLAANLLRFLLAVWLLGLLTEALGLMIRVADHVRALRQTLAPVEEIHDPETEPAAVAAMETAAETAPAT